MKRGRHPHYEDRQTVRKGAAAVGHRLGRWKVATNGNVSHTNCVDCRMGFWSDETDPKWLEVCSGPPANP